MLPERFLQRMRAQLGEEYEEFLNSLERPRAVALRFNPLKGEAPRLPFVGDPVPWEPEGYYYDPEARPGLHIYHEAGVYYLQEASAMARCSCSLPSPARRSVTSALPPAARPPRSRDGCWEKASCCAMKSTPSGQRSCPGTLNGWQSPMPW